MIQRSFPTEFDNHVVLFNQALGFLRSCCVDRLPRMAMPITSADDFVHAFDLICQMYLRRAINLADNYARLVNEGEDFASAIIGRALMETVAHFHFLLGEMQRYLTAKRYDDAFYLVSSYMLGGNHDFFGKGVKLKRFNIMGSLRAMDKAFPHSLREYESLSEYVHPNSIGVMAFSKDDKENNQVVFLEKFESHWVTPALESAVWLLNFKLDWERIPQVKEAFAGWQLSPNWMDKFKP